MSEDTEPTAADIVVCGKGPPHYFIQRGVEAPVLERICPWCQRDAALEALGFTLEAMDRLIPPGDLGMDDWELAAYADSLAKARALLVQHSGEPAASK